MKVEIFVPCFVDQLFPETAFNMVRILESAGCEVIYNTAQTCCGQPAFNAGFHKDCKKVATGFIQTFSGENAVVTVGGSCTGFVRNYYKQLFAESEQAAEIAMKATRFFEFTEFLVQELEVLKVDAVFKAKAVYHDACGALRECGIKAAPRVLLSHVRGLELVETEDCERCCGFGGTFSVKYESISIAMGEQKVHNAIAAGAQYIISTDLSCLMHLDGYIRQHQLPIRTIHIADVLSAGS